VKYDEDPYLEYLTVTELYGRFNDLMQNLLTYTESGKVGIQPPQSGGSEDDRDNGINDPSRWIIRFTHALQEFDRRGLPIPGPEITRQTPILQRFYTKAARATEIWNNAGRARDPYLVKFGQKQHLLEMMEQGKIRVAPASYYSDPSLNPAIQDSELEIKFNLRGARIYQPSGEEIPVIGDVKISDRLESDFYVWCCSYEYDVRLFDDFHYDACLIIDEPSEFLSRLLGQFGSFVPCRAHDHGRVTYIDPLRPVKRINVPMAKHFRYAYQKEYRAVFLPRRRGHRFNPLFLKIGSLRSISRLLEL